MSKELYQKCCEIIAELKLGTADSVTDFTPLEGGVSSDIARVNVGTRSYCIKFALPKLKVAADWNAPVHRNRAEYEWLQLAAAIAPESTVRLFGRSETLHGFVMEYLEGSSVYLWKSALLDEQDNRGEAGRIGDLMGQIHAASTQSSFDPVPFQNADDFYSIRIEPYLVYTASQHPGLAKPITALADHLYKASQVLVHGDISPKNILFRDNTPIILDAECATMGDASFDLAFCLNHLVLKAIHLPSSRKELLDSTLELWQAYQSHIVWENVDALELRVCQLLPALMLARVDGKSPVEYLEVANQELVRSIAIGLIKTPCESLQEFAAAINTKLPS